jgi:NAD(P)-dependent dehydrogenase (short-subunit alcohol dehydrogenase family)
MSLPATPRAVITGAAGGFGRALAIELGRGHAHLTLSDVADCQETARLAEAAGASSVAVQPCDVTKVDEVEALCDACPGPIDLLVNNAGVSSEGAVGELSLRDWRWTLEVDLWGVIHGCHVFVPRLRTQRHGHILNVAAAGAFLSAPRMGAYNVAKAGVVSLSETMAAELAESGVGVTVVCPTFFRSDIVSSGRFTDEELRAKAMKMLERGKDAGDVARATLAAVQRGDLYSLPMADGRWLWRLKRLAPTGFSQLVGWWGRRMTSSGG